METDSQTDRAGESGCPSAVIRQATAGDGEWFTGAIATVSDRIGERRCQQFRRPYDDRSARRRFRRIK